MREHFPVLLVLIPLITAVLMPVLSRGRAAISALLSVLATGASFFMALDLMARVREEGRISYHIGNWAPPWGIEYAVDSLNGFVLVVVAFISLMVALYSYRSVVSEIEHDKRPTFYTLFMLLVTGLLGIVVTGDIFNLYVFIEISSLSGYALIASGRKREALTATFNYLILGTIGATFIIIGVGLLYMVTGSLNMADLSRLLPPLYENRVVLTAFGFFSVGLSLKIALFPLHVWMPGAYTNAPSVVSALLAATSTKVAAYALIRVVYGVFGVEFAPGMGSFTTVLMALGSFGIIAGSVIAISQRSLKTMLAYSSVGQIGYIVLGISLANQTALTGSIIHILNHALMKGALFLVAGILVYRTGVEDISALRGMGRRMPVAMAAFTVAGLSMIGVPLTVGFISKWYLAVGAIEAGHWYVVPVILVSSILTAIYFWRIIESIYFQTPDERVPEIRPETPGAMTYVTAVMAALCIVFGVISSGPVEIAKQAAAMLFSGGPQ